MSQELKGRNGKIVGTNEYFKYLNKSFKFEDIVNIVNEYYYYESLKKLSKDSSSMITSVLYDVRKCSYVLPFISASDRNETAEIIKGLGEISRHWGSSNSSVNKIVSLVLLSTSESKRKSRESISAIQNAERIIRSSSIINLSISGRIALLEKAVKNGVIQASADDPKKLQFLMSIEQGKGSSFLTDVLNYYEYKNNNGKYKGKNGKTICSKEYNENIVKSVFKNKFPVSFSYGGAKKYVNEIEKMLKNIYNEIANDVERGKSNNDYIKDENGSKLINAVEELSKSGVYCGSLKNKIENLMWFVGGNSQQILNLQRNLNALGITGKHGKLKEDGVYGEETLSAWNQLSKSLVSGSVPVLTYVDILQSDLTGVTHKVEVKNISEAKLKNPRLKNLPDMNDYSMLLYMKNGKKSRAFMLDRANYEDGKNLSFHINYDPDKPAFLKKYLNHKEIPESVYIRFKNFTKAGKVVRMSGKTLLVAGLLLDALEAGNAIIDDLNDADKKIGKKSGMAVAKIGSRWAGAAIGAKIGAMAGAAIGSFALGPGTAVGGAVLGLAGGIAGAVGGEEFVNWVFDITDLE